MSVFAEPARQRELPEWKWRRTFHTHVRDLLRPAAIEYDEVVFREIRNGTTVAVAHDDVPRRAASSRRS
jgi:cytosine/adenosine deaminase-related metal-dependent hydrolase